MLLSISCSYVTHMLKREAQKRNYMTFNKKMKQKYICILCFQIITRKWNKKKNTILVIPSSVLKGQMCLARALFIWNMLIVLTRKRPRKGSSQRIFFLFFGSCKSFSRIYDHNFFTTWKHIKPGYQNHWNSWHTKIYKV